MRRKEALVRRRLAWIAAQRLGVAPDYHPDELRLKLAAAVCAVATGTGYVYEVVAAVQAFAMSTGVVLLLLTLHRRERRLGRIHRWIPAENAPPEGVLAADLLLELEAAGAAGIPEPAFRQAHQGEPQGLEALELCLRVGLVVRSPDHTRLMLGAGGRAVVDEAKSRAVPRSLEG